jgi:hypothetical protein
MPSIYSHNTNPIVVTSDLLKRMAWGTHFGGLQRLIVGYDLYLNGLRKCKGELLECGHIVIPGGVKGPESVFYRLQNCNE